MGSVDDPLGMNAIGSVQLIRWHGDCAGQQPAGLSLGSVCAWNNPLTFATVTQVAALSEMQVQAAPSFHNTGVLTLLRSRTLDVVPGAGKAGLLLPDREACRLSRQQTSCVQLGWSKSWIDRTQHRMFRP